MSYLDNYRVEFDHERAGFGYVHVPSGTELLFTQSVSLETLNALAQEFDTYGQIRPNWRRR